MKSLIVIATALLCASLPLQRVTAQAPTDRPVAFTDVNVIPMDEERVLPDQTVLVRDGRIEALGSSDEIDVPDDALVVDGTGKYLMPGLAEMHAHIPSPQQGEDVIERTLFLYLSNGVTTIRGMLGHPRHLELRAQSADGTILAPRIYTSGPSLNGNSAPTPEVATRMVEEQHAAGYDLLKLHPGLQRPVFDAMVEAADRLDMPFAGHVSADVGLDAALASGQASIDHLDAYAEALAGFNDGWAGQQSGWFGFTMTDQFDIDMIPALAEATREAGVWNVPTQSLLEHILTDETSEELARRPELRYMSPSTVDQWLQTVEGMRDESSNRDRVERYLDARRRLIKALHEEGAGLLLGSDAPQILNVPGFSIHHELRALIAAGLTPYEALETGTRNVAEYFETDEFGTIAEGKSADLILLDANPLEDVGNVERRAGVMVRGIWLPEADIQERLERIAGEVRQ